MPVDPGAVPKGSGEVGMGGSGSVSNVSFTTSFL